MNISHCFNNLKMNILFLISAGAFCILNTISLPRMILNILIFSIVLLISMKDKIAYDYNVLKPVIPAAFTVAVYFGYYFYKSLVKSSLLGVLLSKIGLNISSVVLIFAIFATVISVYFISITICKIYMLCNISSPFDKIQDILIYAGQIIIHIYIICIFYIFMHSKKILELSTAAGVTNLFVSTVLCGILLLAVPFIYFRMIAYISSGKYCDETAEKTGISNNKIIFAAALVTSAVAVTICSQSSPLYPLNTWVDAQCYFTVGKSVLSGLMPYRDLFEHKGPLLYLLHTLAAVISFDSFFGVYIIEIIAGTAVLFFAYKIIRLYSPKAGLVTIPVTAAIIYTASSFARGDSAEELCMPFIIYSLWVALKNFREETDIKPAEAFLIGVTSACVLWIKFTMLGVYIGWYFAFAVIMLKDRKLSQLLKTTILIAAGVISVSLIIIIFFAYNGALADLMTVYFYNNLFLYSAGVTENFIMKMFGGMASAVNTNLYEMCILVLGLTAPLVKGKKREFFMVISSFIGLFVFVYIGGVRFFYYPHILLTYVMLGVAMLSMAVDNFLPRRKANILSRRKANILSRVLATGCFVFMYFNCDSTFLMQYEKEETPYYKFAEIINRKPGATLHNRAGLDMGFYTTTGIVPNCKYFAVPNLQLPEIYRETNRYIEEKLVDFVVIGNAKLNSPDYTLVAEENFTLVNDEKIYRLYRLIE